ncbi:unnamed protein product [Prorocentrum cordatum]|uniref:Uncharacterized protein n=1 Tax=Prorocentrum cordatum TaxID=2364126 RepID=A0ABN9R047_9DINO|nr:unnamed protein product [Polarella glacialis]
MLRRGRWLRPVGDLGLRKEPGHSLRCFVEGDGFGAVLEDRAPGGETRDAGCSSRAAGRAAEGTAAVGDLGLRQEPGHSLRASRGMASAPCSKIGRPAVDARCRLLLASRGARGGGNCSRW